LGNTSDSPVRTTITASGASNTSLQSTRSSSWSLLIYFRATGHLELPMEIIFPGISVAASSLDELKGCNIGATATENGYQTTQTFLEHLRVVIPKIGASLTQPALIETDGHNSRVTKEVIEIYNSCST